VQLGRGVHISVVRGAMLSIGDNVNVERDCQLITEGVLSIDANGFVGTGTIIAAAERITIGRDALIAAYSTIRDQDHRRDAGSLPYNRQGLVTDPIVIGDNVWIGTKATILRGVRIGDNAVVGAQAVVTSNVEQDTVVTGIPAKVITRPARQLP
jgi:acetyltransferase-like isoleucine patch superfamily enzyme